MAKKTSTSAKAADSPVISGPHHHIFIVEDESGGLVVRPGFHVTGPGKVPFRNHTDNKVKVEFPPDPKGVQAASITLQPKGDAQKGDRKALNLKGYAEGYYEYSVSMVRNRKRRIARGNSSPSMIVDN